MIVRLVGNVDDVSCVARLVVFFHSFCVAIFDGSYCQLIRAAFAFCVGMVFFDW